MTDCYSLCAPSFQQHLKVKRDLEAKNWDHLWQCPEFVSQIIAPVSQVTLEFLGVIWHQSRIQDLYAAFENTVSGFAPLSWHWEFCRQLYAPLAGCIQPAQTKSLVHLNQLIARQNLSRSVQFCELIPTEHMTRLYSKVTIPHSYVSSRFQTPSLVLSPVTEVWLGTVGQYRHQPTTK